MKLATKVLYKCYIHSHCYYKLSNHISCQFWLIFKSCTSRIPHHHATIYKNRQPELEHVVIFLDSFHLKLALEGSFDCAISLFLRKDASLYMWGEELGKICTSLAIPSSTSYKIIKNNKNRILSHIVSFRACIKVVCTYLEDNLNWQDFQ